MGKYTVLVNENMGEVNWEMVKKADIHGVMLCAGYGGEVDRFFGQMRTAVRNWGFRLVYIGHLMP